MPPESSFVPLAPSAPPASADKADLRITLASPTAKAQPFHAFGHKAPAATPATAPSREPRVTLRHENNRVAAIVVECSCGQTIELACSYDEPPVTAPAPTAVSVPPPPTPAPPTPAVATSPFALSKPAEARPARKSSARKSRRGYGRQ